MTSTPAKPKRKPLKDVIAETYKGINNEVEKLNESALQEVDPEKHQVVIRELDEVLKLLSEHQRTIGAIRKAAGKHNEALRRAKPKGKARPTESEPFTIDGKTYQLINGRPELLENNSGKPDK